MADAKVRQPRNRQRAIAALEMRTQGHTYEHIAKVLGWRDGSGAYRAVSRLLERREAEGIDELRKIHGARLEKLLAAVWPAAASGNLDAVKSACNVLSDISKLYGLDAPARVNVGISQDEFAQQAAELLAVVGDGQLRELARLPAEPTRALPLIVDGEVVRDVAPIERDPEWANIGEHGRVHYDTGKATPAQTADDDPDANNDVDDDADDNDDDGDDVDPETAPVLSIRLGAERGSEAISEPDVPDAVASSADDGPEPDSIVEVIDDDPVPLPTGTRRISASEILSPAGVPARGRFGDFWGQRVGGNRTGPAGPYDPMAGYAPGQR